MILKVKRTENFAVMAREPLDSVVLSYKAKGLYAYLMSKPADWMVRLADLQRGPDGREAVQAGLKELEKLGLAVYQILPGKGGEWTLFETPDLNPANKNKGPAGERVLRLPGKPATGKPGDRETRLYTKKEEVPRKSVTKTDNLSVWRPPKSPTVSQMAEAIYEVYPRKVAKPKAVAAITACLKETSFEDLLRLTAAYEKARKGEDPAYTPHPATWYNQRRYNDEPNTWSNSPKGPGANKGTHNEGGANNLQEVRSKEADAREAQAVADLASLQ